MADLIDGDRGAQHVPGDVEPEHRRRGQPPAHGGSRHSHTDESKRGDQYPVHQSRQSDLSYSTGRNDDVRSATGASGRELGAGVSAPVYQSVAALTAERALRDIARANQRAALLAAIDDERVESIGETQSAVLAAMRPAGCTCDRRPVLCFLFSVTIIIAFVFCFWFSVTITFLFCF